MASRLSVRVLLTAGILFAFAPGCGNDHPFAPQGPDRAGLAEIPPGYYDTVDEGTPAALRASLHAVIDDHQRFPYTSTATDTWDILDQADEDPGNPSHILDVYLNASYPKAGAGNTNYNREHTWPNSYGYPDDNSSNYPYTDCHALFLSNDSYNSTRGNSLYRTCDSGCTERPTELNNGVGGGTGVYPGNSNWSSGAGNGTWETWIDRRGDVARALLYLDVRYEGGTHGGTGVSEPDLILTDNEALVAASNTGSNESVAYMGILTVLLAWHAQDPVDDKERARNDVVYAHQGNRNPFIDHPEWVDCVFNDDCGGGDTTPPAAPTGLSATAGDGQVDLDWDNNTEPDLDGYHVFRSTTPGGGYAQVTGALVAASTYTDATVSNGTTYYYVVRAVDTSANQSGNSNEASATPAGGGGGGPAVWINEFHYDNDKTDRDEFVEVAGPAGTSLAGWQVVGYNGADGGVYATVNLAGSIPDQEDGYGTVAVEFTGLQNGSPDGIALYDGSSVVEFLSYEGSFTATAGPASGLSSTDVGVEEPASTPRGYSLQKTGQGTVSADFTWQAPMPGTDGQPNTGQTFGDGGGDVTPPAAPSGLAATAGDGQVDLDWDDNTEPDLDGYDVYRATASGGPYSQINGSLVAASAYTDNTANNGTTYYYVVRAVDTSANESGDSNQASATPTGGGGGAMHLAAITVTSIPAGGPNEWGQATVTVVDAQGAPVSGASVTGTFTGDVTGTAAAVTNAAGQAVIQSPTKKKGPITFTFCVDGVVKSGWTYDAGANQETCDVFGPS